MKSDLSVIELRLPSVDKAPLPEGYAGEREMLTFWRSGLLDDLPKNPSVGVALSWIIRMSGPFGFTRQLARLGTSHQTVMDEVFAPAEERRLEHLPTTHPLILLHCLYRVSVQVGRDGYVDTKPLIGDMDWGATCHFWNALLPQLIEEQAKVRFITADTPMEWGREVTLGTVTVSLDPRNMSPGISRVLVDGDFSQLPKSPTLLDIGDLALMIDGYTVAESDPEVGDLVEWFNPLWDSHIEEGAALPGSSLHLWLMLFACQRGYLRYLDRRSPLDDIEKTIFGLYRAFRLAARHEQENPSAETPLYVTEP